MNAKAQQLQRYLQKKGQFINAEGMLMEVKSWAVFHCPPVWLEPFFEYVPIEACVALARFFLDRKARPPKTAFNSWLCIIVSN